MTCPGNVCGTGGSNLPKPGDPDNQISLHARTVYGGVDVTWTYPTVNPHAVAHTLVLRGTTGVFADAVQRAVAAGSIFFDKTEVTVATTYHYWIRIVTVNGTVLDPVGPVSATVVPQAQQTLESLTGLIDAGKLAQDLKTSIGMGAEANLAILAEAQARILANSEFAALLQQVQDGLAQAITFVQDETTQRIDGDDALVESINTIAAANQTAMAAIQEEKQVRVTQNEATATQLSTLFTKIGDNASGIIHDINLHTTQISAVASDVNSLATTVGNSSSGLVHDVEVASSQTEANAQSITTLNATVNGNNAAGQVGLVTTVNTLKNEITAEYFVKLENNGLLGGFGLINQGALVEAGFDVDRFWVGRTGPDKVKPFIIDNGTVYIDKAQIRNADIDTLKVAGNAITGLSAAYGSGGVPASGSSTVLYTGISMPSGSSGVIVTGTASLYCANNASVTLILYKNGSQIGSTGVSLQGGFHATATYSALDSSPSVGNSTYSLGFYNPPDGVPGGNQAVSVDSCSLIVSGAKR